MAEALLLRDRRLPFGPIFEPPPDYAIERIVASTYQLDPAALLTVPLALQEAASARDLPEALELTRRLLRVYCHRCRLCVPARPSRLLTSLEQCIVEVLSPAPFVHLHPKLFVIRFAGPGRPIYRLAFLTRNLTLERNWHALVMTDGEVGSRPVDNGRRLAGFVRHLAAAAPFADSERFVGELEHASFEIPEPFTEMRFLPFGFGGYENPLAGLRLDDDVVVATPLLDGTRLLRLAPAGRVFSRRTTLAGLDADARAAYRCDGLSDVSAEAAAEAVAAGDEREPQGVHMKVYAGRRGRSTHILVTSANLTDGAFDRNVEFAVELVAPAADADPAALADWLAEPVEGSERFEPFVADDALPPPVSGETIRALRRLEHDLVDRTRVGLTGAARPLPDGSVELELTVDSTAVAWPTELAVSLAPLSHPLDARGVSPRERRRHVFAGVPLEDVSAYVVIEVRGAGEASSFLTRIDLSRPRLPVGGERAILSEPEHDHCRRARAWLREPLGTSPDDRLRLGVVRAAR
jgi:hypothetical protein